MSARQTGEGDLGALRPSDFVPGEKAGKPVLEPPWYETNDPAVVAAWARDYLVRDLEGSADDLRHKADFIDGKASLLFDMMTTVAARLADVRDDKQPGTEERSDGVKPKASDLSTLTRERDDAVRLLRERDAVVHPHADLVRDIEAFLDRLATVEGKP